MSIWNLLDERNRRVMAASEALSLGYGGVALVHQACGLSRKAISNGIHEIQQGIMPCAGRIRKPGAGRKSLTVSDPTLPDALEKIIDGGSRVVTSRHDNIHTCVCYLCKPAQQIHAPTHGALTKTRSGKPVRMVA